MRIRPKAPQQWSAHYSMVHRTIRAFGALTCVLAVSSSTLSLAAALDAGQCAARIRMATKQFTVPPSACLSYGPFHLGMPRAAVLRLFGVPSHEQTRGERWDDLIYLGRASAKVHPNVEFLFKERVLVAVQAMDERSRSPYAFLGFKLGDHLGALEAKIGPPSETNNFGDSAWWGQFLNVGYDDANGDRVAILTVMLDASYLNDCLAGWHMEQRTSSDLRRRIIARHIVFGVLGTCR